MTRSHHNVTCLHKECVANLIVTHPMLRCTCIDAEDSGRLVVYPLGGSQSRPEVVVAGALTAPPVTARLVPLCICVDADTIVD
ncbi:hypothetical protein BHE74_00056868 [Ensete ventricosum]|nr:hypothetical protein GW17_00038556 [Ensete ventricosum]RWW37949.1 hypothetical protein BHE74_00056868 [Ensete ventricosum]RZS23955.1 hypothetical protein BHM03_00056973 [Ensete ventricosum]